MTRNDRLRVRVYNVHFGDAILISVPDRNETRHILLDVGNVLGGTGGQDDVFKPIVEDVRQVLDGRPLDLYVMTHEHLDHVQGLYLAFKVHGLSLPVERAWLTASAQTSYYDTHKAAKTKRERARKALDAVERYFAACGACPTGIRSLLLNNSPLSTEPCVDHLRNLAPQRTSYVFRGCDVDAQSLFREEGTSIEIWAPEEDTSIYYGVFRPAALGLTRGRGRARIQPTVPLPPPGVDAGAFFDLVEFRRRGYGDNLLSIDAAANNTSIVFCLEWRGWRLLFPGDAEHRSWKEMNKRGLLKPVHFLKVGHHGSANGTPPPELLEKILPQSPPDDRPRFAAVSTCAGSYQGVPDPGTIERLSERCTVRSVEDLPPTEPYMDFDFPPG